MVCESFFCIHLLYPSLGRNHINDERLGQSRYVGHLSQVAVSRLGSANGLDRTKSVGSTKSKTSDWDNRAIGHLSQVAI